jgi:hypothetical protein
MRRAKVHLDEGKYRVYKDFMGRRLQPPPVPVHEPPAKGRKGDHAAPEKDLLTALTTPIEKSRDLIQVMLTLPKAHIRVLDTEASVFGMRRYQFLELLLLGELSQPMMVRPPFMAPYRFTRGELTETERFVIYMRPEVKHLLDEHLLRLGVKPSSWAAMAIVKWASLTEALKAVK